jgi:hypothetical protein
MSMSGSDKIAISYKLDDFMKYQDINNVLPTNLVSFCSEYGGDVVLREGLLKQTESIINNYLSGKNPNDIVFKNTTVEYLNKVSFKTYASCLETLKKLNYTHKDHFDTLASELVMRAMTDTIVVKGLELPEGQHTLSELYADIAAEFSSFLVRTAKGDIKFVSVLMDMCQRYFVDFTDNTKPLDQNNQYRVDNFKGFMNFLGLLFNRGIISHEIIYTCLAKLKDLIFIESWGQNESENVFDGYTKLMNQILAIGEKKSVRRTHVDVDYVNKVRLLHTEIRQKNDLKPKLRKFTMLSHRDIDNRLGKLITYIEKTVKV